MNERSNFACSELDGKIYVFGGFGSIQTLNKRKGGATNSNIINKAEVFDPKSNTWTALPDMEYRRRGCTSSVVGSNIYITGGVGPNNSNSLPIETVEVFDTIANIWMCDKLRPNNMKSPTMKHASISVGAKIYVFGGERGDIISDRTEVLDTATGEWTFLNSMNLGRSEFAYTIVDKKIYIMGGLGAIRKRCVHDPYYKYLDSMEIYNIEEDIWQISPVKMNNRRAGCSAVYFASASSIIVLGGHDYETKHVEAIETFDLVHQMKWHGSLIHPFENPRYDFYALLYHNTLMVMGGTKTTSLGRSRSNLSFLHTVEGYINVPKQSPSSFSSEKMLIPGANKKSNKIQSKEDTKNT